MDLMHDVPDLDEKVKKSIKKKKKKREVRGKARNAWKAEKNTGGMKPFEAFDLTRKGGPQMSFLSPIERNNDVQIVPREQAIKKIQGNEHL